MSIARSAASVVAATVLVSTAFAVGASAQDDGRQIRVCQHATKAADQAILELAEVTRLTAETLTPAREGDMATVEGQLYKVQAADAKVDAAMAHYDRMRGACRD